MYSEKVFGINAVKKERVRKNYRIKIIDDKIRARRTKSEAKLIARASSNGVNTPKVLMVGNNSIFIERIYGEMLNSLLAKKKTDSKMLKSIIEQSGNQLALLHMLNISHGDYTPANILVDKKGKAWIIDFGLSELTNSVEDRAIDLFLMKRSISKKLYLYFVRSYLYTKGFKHGEYMVERLKEIEKRGRYQTRTLITS